MQRVEGVLEGVDADDRDAGAQHAAGGGGLVGRGEEDLCAGGGRGARLGFDATDVADSPVDPATTTPEVPLAR